MARVSEATREETRQRLLAAAAVAFAERGLEGANVNDVSVGAGFAKGTVYNYFASKQELFAAVLERTFELVTERAADGPEAASTRTRLRAAVNADMEWARDHAAFAKVLVREAMSCTPDAYSRVAQAAGPYLDHLTVVLRDGQRRGDIRADRDTGELAWVLVGLGVLALAQHWGSGGLWPTFEQIPDLVVDTFLDGARRPEPRRPPRLGSRDPDGILERFAPPT